MLETQNTPSEIPMSEVYSFIASEIHGDNIAWINVTNPLAETQIYEEACNLYHKMESKYDCLRAQLPFKRMCFSMVNLWLQTLSMAALTRFEGP